jgi:hypothetical protein
VEERGGGVKKGARSYGARNASWARHTLLMHDTPCSIASYSADEPHFEGYTRRILRIAPCTLV